MPSRSAAPSARQRILICLLGAILVVLHTWPLAARLDRVGRPDSFDGQYSLWQATWVARALVTDPLHVYDANIFYPHRSTLAFSEPTLLAGIFGLPAYLVTKSPYATHNLAVLAFFLLAFLSAYALGRHLTGEIAPAIALGISFAFSPYMFARTAQLPMMAIFGLPLSALAMHRLVEAPSMETATVVAGALFLQALACGYYTVFALLIVGTGILFFGLHPARLRAVSYWRYVTIAAVLSVVCLMPLFWPHLRLARDEGFTRSVDEASRFAADWRAWLASSAWAHRWMLRFLGTWNEVLFPGFLATALGIAGAWLGLTGRLGRSDRAVSTRSLAGFYALIGVLAIWLAFGPAGGLYGFLYDTVPVFAFIRSSGRFGIVTTLAADALMTLVLAHLMRRSDQGRTLVTALVVVLCAELYSGPRANVPALPIGPVYHMLADQPRGPVVEFPMFPRSPEQNARYVLMSTAHWQPLVNGYGAFWPADIQSFAADTKGFPSGGAFDVVRRWGVRYVVVHPTLYERHGLATASDVIGRLDALNAQLTFIASDQQSRLYQVNGWSGKP
jgi:hypothetical protein